MTDTPYRPERLDSGPRGWAVGRTGEKPRITGLTFGEAVAIAHDLNGVATATLADLLKLGKLPNE